MSRVVIAGAGTIGAALGRALADAHEVRLVVSPDEAATRPSGSHAADLTAIPEAEVALAGAHAVVLLAQARRPPARLTRAALDDLDRLLADAVARAARRVGASHLVLFACGEADARVPLLEQSGLPLSVLRGGGPDPVAALVEVLARGPGPAVTTAAWSGLAPAQGPRAGLETCSVQRTPRPPGWSALDVARAYFTWLPGEVLGVRTEERAGVFRIRGFGVEALTLRFVPGRSEADSAWLEVAEGALTRAGGAPGRFEFRVLQGGDEVVSALVGYRPALPWPVYRFSQALAHERVMRRFGAWLSQQRGAPPRAA